MFNKAIKKIKENKHEIKLLTNLYIETDDLHTNKRSQILKNLTSLKVQNKQLTEIIQKKEKLEQLISENEKILGQYKNEIKEILKNYEDEMPEV